MFELILETARQDERIRAVLLNGSRANPNAPRDLFQDFDIVYLVTDMDHFKADPSWINRFGELIIMQLPDEMTDPHPKHQPSYAYLMQFKDGNRIDLTLFPIENISQLKHDSQTVVLLDKDALFTNIPASSDRDYFPKKPTEKQYQDCCNEFWWMCSYVAKGLWRRQITYAKAMQEHYVREQLMKMLNWYIGVKTSFAVSPGKEGKYFQEYLSNDYWMRLMQTYASADLDQSWDALFRMMDLFRETAVYVAEHFSLDYPHTEDKNVSDFLRAIRSLPENAETIY